jgi:hypothetical protein
LFNISINFSSYVCSGVFENHVRLHRMIQEETSIFWEVIVSAIVGKKVHINMLLILNSYLDKVYK